MTTAAPPQAGAQEPATPPAEVARARVAVMVSTYQVDVVVPTKFTIETFIDDLLAVLAESIDEEVDFTPPTGQWSLARPGQPPIPRWRTLTEHDVVDGAVLMLAPVESAEIFTPIVEDITDALAKINDREFAEFDGEVAARVGVTGLIVAAFTVAVLLSVSWTQSASVGWCAVPALALGMTLWGVAAATRLQFRFPWIRLGIALAAAPLMFAGGAMLIPPAYDRPGPFAAANIATGAVVAAVSTATVLLVTRRGIATLTTLTMLGAIVAAASMAMTYLSLSASQVATGTVLVGLVIFALAPRAAVVIARIRPPDLPDPGDDVSPATLNDIFDAESGKDHEPDSGIESRARLAVTSLIGLIVAVSIVIPVGTITAAAAHPGGIKEIVMAAAVAVILVLRARSFPDRIQATALLTASIAIVAGVSYVVVDAYTTPLARLVVALVVVAVAVAGCFAAVLLPGVRLSPVTRRVIDLIEFALIVVVPVVTFMVMGIYTAMRRI